MYCISTVRYIGAVQGSRSHLLSVQFSLRLRPYQSMVFFFYRYFRFDTLSGIIRTTYQVVSIRIHVRDACPVVTSEALHQKQSTRILTNRQGCFSSRGQFGTGAAVWPRLRSVQSDSPISKLRSLPCKCNRGAGPRQDRHGQHVDSSLRRFYCL